MLFVRGIFVYCTVQTTDYRHTETVLSDMTPWLWVKSGVLHTFICTSTDIRTVVLGG